MIRVDRRKAEAITLDRLRADRAERLQALDLSVMRAIEGGQDIKPLAAEKQALRDVTKKDLSALDLGELAALDLDAALEL